MTAIIFWVSACFVVYTYAGYPLLLGLWSAFRKQPVHKGHRVDSISVVIAAFNEEAHIEQRIRNLLASDYPREKMEILIISDGSSDQTEVIAKSFGAPVKVFSLPQRSGKASAIQLGVTEASNEIILFTDARQVFEKNTIQQLVSNFNDPRVGAVSGRLFLRSETQESNINRSLDLYWALEEWIRQKESVIDSSIGVTGAIYAIRRPLYPSLPPETILDDVYIPMKIALKGFRVLMDDSAKAYDILTSSKKELKRKIRTLAGNYQLMALMPEVLSPTMNRLWLQYFSHKVTRLLAPYFLLTAFVANGFMLHNLFFLLTFLIQTVFYFCAFLGYVFKNNQRLYRFFSIPYGFMVLNYAAICSLFHFLKGTKKLW